MGVVLVTYSLQPEAEQDADPGDDGDGPPPQKKNIVLRVVLVVLVLAGLGLTGFVAPGFLLSEEGDTPVGGSPSASAKAEGVEDRLRISESIPDDAMAIVNGFLADVNKGRAAAAKAVLCENKLGGAARVDKLIGDDARLAIDPGMGGGLAAEDGSVHSVQLDLLGTVKGRQVGMDNKNGVHVNNWDGPWCVWDFWVAS
jgi:hypothetical protein